MGTSSAYRCLDFSCLILYSIHLYIWAGDGECFVGKSMYSSKKYSISCLSAAFTRMLSNILAFRMVSTSESRCRNSETHLPNGP
ncbi:hypothetical protein PF005_g23386 [Phytophthora fragariae]|uniref:Secreted protein n=2 Tax=Phytophthora TaxID=4783 RepID=A0A6A3S1A7_9STRA|nr:hypothetical protein PF003_g6301 [Phytophthora fragariae]KAE8987924.1 hypothetical protein PR002_g21916 [Phytophthora rubi]KAE8935182.1 hypothetical protein PF009_g14859 [Phytophthora fragariae]KAE8982680.1 hypothetical protein PF011_g21510 [Phytophthora fragariae]KAE8990748.1 hypothetical protein PR001_g21407 [Phytophthora rubi]